MSDEGLKALADETAPKQIWLNTAGSYANAYEATIGSETGVTWCNTPQDDGDQEYIRADLAAAEIDRLRAEIDRLNLALDKRDFLIEEWDRRAEQIGGCSDGNCTIHRLRGQHTNGGCKCDYGAPYKARKALLIAASYRQRLLALARAAKEVM